MSKCYMLALLFKNTDATVVRLSGLSVDSRTDLASVVVDDEALVPAVEVFVGVDLDSELLQHGLVGSLAHRMHGGAHVVQDAHDARRILRSRGKRSDHHRL